MIKNTSGSTGQYLIVHWYEFDDVRAMAELLILRKEYYGIVPNDLYCFFILQSIEKIGLLMKNPAISLKIKGESDLARIC